MAYQIPPFTLGSFRGDRRRTDGQTDGQTDGRHSATYIILICRVEEPTPLGFDKSSMSNCPALHSQVKIGIN